MPRQRIEPGGAPRRRREALGQPIARRTRMYVFRAMVDKRDVGMTQKGVEYVDTEPDPAQERRRKRHALGSGLARSPGCVFGSAPHPWPMRGCGRIPPTLRAIHRNRHDVMPPSEGVDRSGYGSRRQVLPRPPDRPGNGLHKVAVVESDQRGADVIPGPTGEVNPQDASRTASDAHSHPLRPNGARSATAPRYSGRAIATNSLAMSSQPTVAMMYCRPFTM